MKLKALLLAASLALAVECFAQSTATPTAGRTPVTRTSRWNDYARQQYCSLRFGFNSSTGWFNHNRISHVNTSGRTGFNVALIFGKQITSPDVPLFIEFGVGYSQKGFKSRFAEADGDYQYRHNMNFLEVPLHLKYKIKTGVDDFTVQPFVGGFFDFGVSSNTFIYSHPNEAKCRTRVSTFGKEIFSRVDAGVRLGVGVAYQNFYFEGRYDFGLMDVCGDKIKRYYPMYEGFDESARNGCFSLSLGVEF